MTMLNVANTFSRLAEETTHYSSCTSPFPTGLKHSFYHM